MLKTHLLAKIQLIVAIIWGVTGFMVLVFSGSADEFWLFVFEISFVSLSGITFFLGWIMVFGKKIVIYPHEVFFIRKARRRNNQKRAYRIQKYAEGNLKRVYWGGMNLVTGFFGLILGLAVFAEIL